LTTPKLASHNDRCCVFSQTITIMITFKRTISALCFAAGLVLPVTLSADDAAINSGANAPAITETAPAAEASGEHVESTRLPPPLETYQKYEKEHNITGVWNILVSRVKQTPFNLVASILFLLAILHTFLAIPITNHANKLEELHIEKVRKELGEEAAAKAAGETYIPARILHFLGEVEVVFALWCIPLVIAMICMYSYKDFVGFFDTKLDYKEPLFVVAIMIMANTKPIIRFAQSCLRFFANKLGGNSPAAWWISILIIGPLLGSFITEPGAMTISALLLAAMIYKYQPSDSLKYGTIGLLFVNVSVGGVLTHFAAPPVLMVAEKWHWNMPYMFENFGWKAAIGIVCSTVLYYFIYRKELHDLKDATAKDPTFGLSDKATKVPAWIIAGVILFMTWEVMTVHSTYLFMAGLLFFFGFHAITRNWQEKLEIRPAIMVGFFLAGLVTHGTLQAWWLEPVLASLKPVTLFLGGAFLTSFNDNAAITYLCSQVPEFLTNQTLQHSVMYGAVTGGGLTVIANAPNPAGQSILQGFFKGGVSPVKLAVAAIIPTIVVGCAFWFLPTL
jgi:hypothetical protein